MNPQRLADFLKQQCAIRSTDKKLVHTASDSVIKALLPVHLYGQCADMDEICQIAQQYNLPVVEDACQALGAVYKGRRAGALGDFGCFSFFPSKNLGGAGDGGMILAANSQSADILRRLRTHGEHSRYFHSIIGVNSRLDELQAAVLRVKLPYLDSWNRARQQNAADYGQFFDEAGLSDFVTPPVLLPDRTHIFHQYVVRCRQRDELKMFLKDKGVDTNVYYPVSLHEQECFGHFGYCEQDMPCSHAASQETLALPVYPELTIEQKKHVVASVAAFYEK